MSEKREHWSGNWGFLMALAGSAIGLGNIWKFPYVTGKYGGGAFVLVYLCCIMVIGLPILIGELTIGRTTGLNPIGAFAALCPKRSKLADLLGGIILLSGIALITFSQIGYGILVMLLGAVILYGGWKAIGLISGVITPFLILGYYGVVGGWTLIYAVKAVTGNLVFKTAAEAQAAFTPIQQAAPGTWWYVIGGQLAFMTLCGIILWFGVKKGIERCSKVLMPSLFVLLIVLILRSISLPGASAGIKFFLSPDFSKLSAEAVLVALGQAFYTLSLGMGISIVYGSYVRKETNLPKSVLQLIGLDTMVAMMAGLAIFPAVFAMGFEPAAGEGLVFQILPTAFNMIPGGLGSVWSSFFFIAVAIAALTSGISLMEVIVSVLIDYFKMKRWAAVLFSWSSISILGVFCSISMNSWKNIPWMEKGLTTLFGTPPGSLFLTLDNLTANWFLPAAGMAVSVFVGWVWGVRNAVNEIRKGAGRELDTNFFILLSGMRGESGYGDSYKHIFTPASVWGFFIRFITPVSVMFVFLNMTGAIKFN